MEYGPTSAYGSLTLLNATPAVAHAVPLTGLTPNTLYHYRVRSNAVSGSDVSADFSFRTSGAATFLKTDVITQGNWRSAYGADGYTIAGDLTANPVYVAPVVAGQASYTWFTSSADVRALQKASNPADRIVATWYSANSFTLDLNMSDQAPHQVALYCLDWDSTARRQSVDVLDAYGNPLSTQALTSFNGGVYLVWNVTGHVQLRIRWIAGSNAVVAGVFFGGSLATASFVKTDINTQGNWRSAYGIEGYNVIGDLSVNPAYVAPVPTGQSTYMWAASTGDIRALQKASNPGNRIATTWYSSNPFFIDLNMSDAAQHQVALYCVDWDSTGRRQIVDVLDMNGNVISTQALTTSFNAGVYLVWNVTGHVKFRITSTGILNGVVAGIFFGGSAAASFVKLDSTTTGNWRGVYGADGYNVVGDLAINPAYVAPVISGQAAYTWVASTANVRAPQKPFNPVDRIAATWYSGTSFTIDLNITEQATHQIALYCIDWDSTGRRQSIDVLDAGGTVLSTKALTTAFDGGVYLVWNVTGHVKLRVSWNGGYNAVVSGLFFR